MAYHVYVLANPDDRFYVGQTSDLDRRLFQHNDPQDALTKYTKRFPGPWRLLHAECFQTRSEAMRREKQLKSNQARVWIRSVLLHDNSAVE